MTGYQDVKEGSIDIKKTVSGLFEQRLFQGLEKLQRLPLTEDYESQVFLTDADVDL